MPLAKRKRPRLAAAGAEVSSRLDRGPGQPEATARPDRTASSTSPSTTTSRSFAPELRGRPAASSQALGSALAGSGRPLIVTSGTGIANTVPGQPAREDDAIVGSDGHPRAASEEAAAASRPTGVNVSVVRLPQVHDTVKQGLITPAIAIAAREGRVRLCRRRPATAGRRRMSSTWPGSIGWRSRRPSRTPGITRSRKRACRCATSPKPSAGA